MHRTRFSETNTKTVMAQDDEQWQLCEKTNKKPWSFKVKRRVLNWLGHLLGINESIQARRVLSAFLNPCERPPGIPKETWLNYVR